MCHVSIKTNQHVQLQLQLLLHKHYYNVHSKKHIHVHTIQWIVQYTILHDLYKRWVWGVFVYLPVSMANLCADVLNLAKEYFK